MLLQIMVAQTLAFAGINPVRTTPPDPLATIVAPADRTRVVSVADAAAISAVSPDRPPALPWIAPAPLALPRDLLGGPVDDVESAELFTTLGFANAVRVGNSVVYSRSDRSLSEFALRVVLDDDDRVVSLALTQPASSPLMGVTLAATAALGLVQQLVPAMDAPAAAAMQRTELLSEPGVPNPVGRMVEEVMSGARASVMIPFVHSLVRLERVGGDHNARLLVAVGSPDGIDLQTVRVRSKARRSSRR